MFVRLAKTLYGNFKTKEELRKFGLLAGIFGFTIGVYWILRPLKDTVFLSTVGSEWLPLAKTLSVLIIVPLIFIYSKMVERFARQNLFYILCSIYGVATLLFAYFLSNPTIGLANTVESPYRFIGWAWYVFVESFGSLLPGLFWSFASDTTTPDSAKRGFPLVALGAQLGGVVGPLSSLPLVSSFGIPFVTMISGFGIFSIALMVLYFTQTTPKDQLSGFGGGKKEEKETAKKKTGFLEGIKLIISQKYLLSIFAVVSIYEVIVTILDFHFKSLVKSNLSVASEIAPYLFKYSIYTNGVALACILLGVNAIGRKIGLKASLLLTPALVGLAVVLVSFKPVLGVAMLIMVSCKALNYALNQPTKEQLYIPTSKDAKYKSKAWIDMFGSRFSKFGGSAINMFKGPLGVTMFMLASAAISFGLIGVWALAATYLAKINTKAVKESKFVC